MDKLNLPSYAYKISESDNKTYIFDPIRKKNLVLTPEEWVRQHFINLLVTHYQYPKTLIRLEGGLRYNKMAKRSDIEVFDTNGNPFLLVECKATFVEINQKVIEQASIYNKTIKAPYLCVTNGLRTFCFAVNQETEKIEQLKDLPKF